MEPIKQVVEDSIKNHTGIESKTTGKIRMKIWTGPCIDPVTTKIFQSKGYYTDTHSVYAVPKHKFNAFIENKFYLRPEDLRETSAKLHGPQNSISEYFRRTYPAAKNFVELNDDEVEGRPVKIDNQQHDKLTRLLTFFLREVYNCTVIPGGTSFLPGGVPDPNDHEVEANVLNDGIIDYKNVSFVISPYVKRETINVVPRGGGNKISDTQAHALSFNTRVDEGAKQISVFTQNQYANPFCFAFQPDIKADGDLWFEGLKTSLSKGLIELWADDIGGGPMLRASRQSVYEAAARYYKDINPTNLRYNGYRVNPAATLLPSNAVTPVKTYIEDIFGDPTFYAGILAVLNQLLTGLNDNSNKNLNRFIDLGSFDYNALYNTKLGSEI